MDKILPKFITDRIPMFGGSSESGDNKPVSANNTNMTPPKDLNELVDRIMDNVNIDNKTKREILTVILKNLENENSMPSGQPMRAALAANNNNHVSPAAVSSGYMAPLQYQMSPMMHPYQQPVPYPIPVQPSYMPMPYQVPYPTSMLATQPGSYQLDMLTTKVNDLSSELGELVALVKGQLGDEGLSTNSSRLAHIKRLISGLSSNSNKSASSNSLVSISGPSTAPSEGEPMANEEPASPEPETVSDLPSKTSSVNNSIVSSVGSAINSINSVLGLNSSSTKSENANKESTTSPAETTQTPAAQPGTENKTKLSEEAQRVLDEESAAAASNTKQANNMYDLNNYPMDESNPPEQKSINTTLSNNKVINAQSNLATPAAANTQQTAATNTQQTAATNTQQTAATNTTKPAGNVQPVAKPAGNVQPVTKPAGNTPSKAGNLADAISNLNKSAAVTGIPVQPEQQQLQTGGAKTMKKKSRGVLGTVADALGLTNDSHTKKNTNHKRGRLDKTKI